MRHRRKGLVGLGGGAAFEHVFLVIADGGFLHLQVQPVARIGVGAGQFLVYLNTKTRSGRHRDISALDREAALDQVKVELGFDGFTHQDVGDRGRELHVGRPFERAGVKVGGDLRVPSLGQRGDFLGFPDAACAAKRRLQDRGARAQGVGEFLFGGEPLARRDGILTAAATLASSCRVSGGIGSSYQSGE